MPDDGPVEAAAGGGSAGADGPDDAPVRLRLDIAYDGSAFLGWAKQPVLRTVQGELEAALATVFSRSGPPPTLTVAGRTDAGVHATGQVAHLDLSPAQFEKRAVSRDNASPLYRGKSTSAPSRHRVLSAERRAQRDAQAQIP